MKYRLVGDMKYPLRDMKYRWNDMKYCLRQYGQSQGVSLRQYGAAALHKRSVFIYEVYFISEAYFIFAPANTSWQSSAGLPWRGIVCPAKRTSNTHKGHRCLSLRCGGAIGTKRKVFPLCSCGAAALHKRSVFISEAYFIFPQPADSKYSSRHSPRSVISRAVGQPT